MSDMVCTLTPSESKRLLAKAVARLHQVQRAKESGKLFIGNGSTNSFVAEELFGFNMEKKLFPCGVVTGGVTCRTPASRLAPLYYVCGREVIPPDNVAMYDFMRSFVEGMRPGDIFIKGANAVDKDRNIGILLAHNQAGTIGVALPVLSAQGVQIVAPVGLEKLVVSVIESGRSLPGIHKNKYSFGHGVGYIVITNALVITEIEALKILTGVETTHLGSGGIGGSEGSVILLVRGSDQEIEDTYKLIKGIKGGKKFGGWKYKCNECEFKCDHSHLPL
ncbi:MAG: hypothetical protein M1543_00430 [Firmicutes bacterium]|nr:hypothetical protein [Bacillota bacterium]